MHISERRYQIRNSEQKISKSSVDKVTVIYFLSYCSYCTFASATLLQLPGLRSILLSEGNACIFIYLFFFKKKFEEFFQ